MKIKHEIYDRLCSQPQRFAVCLLMSALWLLAAISVAEGRDDAVVRGKIAFDETRSESWDGNRLVVPYPEIVASLRERINYLPPYPKEFNSWKPEQRLDWERKFIETEAGKKFLEERKKRFAAAQVFDIKFEKDGSFVIYDVPVGIYGIQGRVDKEIGGIRYGFEVFGQIEIIEDVDELVLQPMRVEVTPLMTAGQLAPPFEIKTLDNKDVLTKETFKDAQYLFVNFWTSASPSAPMEQKLIQEMIDSIKQKHDILGLSINVDTDGQEALTFAVKNNMNVGTNGFTGGLEHRMLFDYGVRSLPSFWLIGKDGKIVMTQYEIAQAMRVKPSLTEIILDRIEGRDTPTPAEKKPGTAAGN